jgi:hypothetical protein
VRGFMGSWKQNADLLQGVWRASRLGMNTRLSLGLLELVPQLLFYAAHATVTFTMFHEVHGELQDTRALLVFLFLMFAVDSLGDAMMFKGVHEYTRSLRRGQALYYLLSPGMPLFKVLFLRWDMPMVLLGGIFALVGVAMSFVFYATSPFVVLLCLALGIVTHMILTSAFHIIQAYFDPTMPIGLGSPASRYYTKPLHLFFSGSTTLGVLMTLYPAYFITAFPAGIAVHHTVGTWPQHPVACYVVGMGCLLLWAIGLNEIIKKSCKLRQN